MSEAAVPQSLKSIERFIKTAKQLEKHDPIVAYYARYYAVQQGIELRSKQPSDDSKSFLHTLMDRLEHDKVRAEELLKGADAGTYMREFAARIFKRADDEDRAARANKETARAFLHASIFFECCKLFGPLPAEIAELVRYAKWRAGQINSAVREGRAVTPPQSDELTLEDELTAHMDISAVSPVVSPTATVHTSPINSVAPQVSPVTNHMTSDNHVTPSYTVTNHVTPSPTNHVPAPVARAPEPAPIQTRQASHVPSADHVTAQGYKPTDDAVIEAQKYAKYVVSALQFDDVNTAVVNLKRCYSLLTGLPL